MSDVSQSAQPGKLVPPPNRPPMVPPLKVAPGASGPKATIAPLPNPTLPKPTLPTVPQPLMPSGGLGNLNQAKLGSVPPMPAPSPLMPTKPLSQPPMPPLNSAPAQSLNSSPSSAPTQSPVAKPTPADAPKFAEIRKSPLRFFPFLMGGVLVLVLLVFIVSKLFGGSSSTTTTTSGNTTNPTVTSTPITLTYWGLWEPSAALNQVFTDYEASHPNIRINYVQQPYQDYAVRLQTAISKQTGPDIFRFHASWVPMLRQELSPMPTTTYSDAEYKSTFYPIAAKQLTVNNSYVGIPLEYDGLELFYNTAFLQTANVQPPTTWADMKRIAAQLTIRDANGSKIQRAGLAIGNTANVDHFSDILGLLMLQNGVNPTDVTSKAAQDAISFYTSFITQDKVWDATLPNSVTAFARGDVAMIFAPSWRAHDIQAMNPNLKFAVAAVPQLTSTKITWGSYWAEGVNALSPHQAAAWDFLKYMSSASTMQKFYSDASKVRAFGEVYSRKDLAGSLATDPYVGAFVSDAPYAQNWYLNSATHDNGINDNIIKYFEDAINQATSGNATVIPNALMTVQQGQAQVLGQYGIRLAVPTGSQ